MYYEEKIINGVLCGRYSPDGEFVPINPKYKYVVVVNAMLSLDEETRLAVMRFFCRGCGTTNLPCYCMRDE